jgi:hypothetical protein
MTLMNATAALSPYGVSYLPDGELMAAIGRLAARSNHITAEMLAHVGEIDHRRLYLQAACPSMFMYCTSILHLSEDSAYKCITAARAARRYPLVLKMVAAGDLHLTAVRLLAPHLRTANHEELLHAAVHKTKCEVQQLIASRFPLPDVAAQVRKLPDAASVPTRATPARSTEQSPAERLSAMPLTCPAGYAPAVVQDRRQGLAQTRAQPQYTDQGSDCAAPRGSPAPRASIAAPSSASMPSPPSAALDALPLRPRGCVRGEITPLSAERYKVQFTASRALRDKLKAAQNLLRHRVPDGDLAHVVERAMDLLLRKLRVNRFGQVERTGMRVSGETHAPLSSTPSAGNLSAKAQRHRTRHIPNAIKRQVAERDQYQCTYVDRSGRRCPERGLVQFHHSEQPFARGGEHSTANIRLLCAAHNQEAAALEYGAATVERRRHASTSTSTSGRAGTGASECASAKGNACVPRDQGSPANPSDECPGRAARGGSAQAARGPPSDRERPG